MIGTLTFKPDTSKTATNGRGMFVKMLTCSHCERQTFKIGYPPGIDHAHLYCCNAKCKATYCNESCPA